MKKQERQERTEKSNNGEMAGTSPFQEEEMKKIECLQEEQNECIEGDDLGEDEPGPSCRVVLVKDANTGKFKIESEGCSSEDIEEVKHHLDGLVKDDGGGKGTPGEGESEE